MDCLQGGWIQVRYDAMINEKIDSLGPADFNGGVDKSK